LGLDAPNAASWAEHVDAWAGDLALDGRTPATVAGYVKHLGWLAGDVSGLYPDPYRLTGDAIAHWLEQQSWSLTTRRRVWVSLRSFYAWSIDTGRCRRSPLLGVPALPASPPGPRRRRTPPAWSEPLEGYLATMRAAARQPGTVAVTRARLLLLAHTFGDPWAVTAEDLVAWLAREDWSPETKRAQLGTARRFYRWAVRSGVTVQDPTEPLEAVRLRRTLPRPAPDDAVQAALERADDRTRMMLLLAGLAGLRRAEVAGLHTRDVGAATLVVTGKGGHERQVPMHPQLARELHAELRRRREGDPPGTGWGLARLPAEGWLFPSPSVAGQHLTAERVGRLVSAALPAGWTCHTLRHRFATQAYAGQRDLRAVQELLGHTKPETTARYAAVPTGALASAVAAAHM
jgi:site-specific recombinase XerD